MKKYTDKHELEFSMAGSFEVYQPKQHNKTVVDICIPLKKSYKKLWLFKAVALTLILIIARADILVDASRIDILIDCVFLIIIYINGTLIEK